MTIVVIVLLVLAALLLLYGIVTYNRLVRLRTQSEEGFSDIDVQLKRRHDLIPNLVETVKGYAAHERATFENVTAARNAAVAASGPQEQARAENALTGALRQLFAVAEAYPDLKASQNFIELQDEITDTEDKIQAARRFYNMTVRDLNVAIDQFPSSVVAGFGNFEKREFFELDEPADREVPVVSFGTTPPAAAAPAGGQTPPAASPPPSGPGPGSAPGSGPAS
jgi:LemA protein